MVGTGMSCSATDPCSPNPCYPGTTCTTRSDGGFDCGPCPDDLVGDGITCGEKEEIECPEGTVNDGSGVCKDIDDCRSDACHPGVACRDLPAPNRGYECGPCPRGTEGNGVYCAEKGISLSN